MPSDVPVPRLIYHLALHEEWRDVAESGEHYRRSTLGKSLDDEGFIHCSFAEQVQVTADILYYGRRDVVLLAIDPSRLLADVRIENLEGGTELFPHIYGPLPLAAVVLAAVVPLDGSGRLMTERFIKRD